MTGALTLMRNTDRGRSANVLGLKRLRNDLLRLGDLYVQTPGTRGESTRSCEARFRGAGESRRCGMLSAACGKATDAATRAILGSKRRERS